MRITRYDRLTVWYEYGGGVSTDAAARARMLGDWRAMLEVLRAEYPATARCDWPMNITSTTAASPALCAGWWGGSSCRRTPLQKAQRAWQPPTNGDAAKLRTVYEFAEKENAAE
ncbi:hypothetical protein NIA69_21640 [Gemmiger formicilis]|nr:hypothetical protein [Gemmiger formicilis]